MTEFPAINMAAGTSFVDTWRDCTAMTEFKVTDLSSGTNFYRAWFNCSSLTEFPEIDLSSGTNFTNAWRGCSAMETFGVTDLSLGTDFTEAWRECTKLRNFPAGVFDGSSATAFNLTFLNCELSAESVDNILVSLASNTSTGGTIIFNIGLNEAPTSVGRAARDTLTGPGRSWTVNLATRVVGAATATATSGGSAEGSVEGP